MISEQFHVYSAILLMIIATLAKDHVDIEGYLISTEGCRIPDFPLITKEIENLMIPTVQINCSENLHLLDFNSTHIWIVEDSLDFYNVFNTNEFFCCYKYFYVENNIAQIQYGECLEFKKIIKAAHEYTRVECFYLDIKIYDDYFLFPLLTKAKPSVTRSNNNSQPTFNVLLFGIESISRMNFMRMMPKTFKFLQAHGSIQLLGYNKIGENSFPNLFPLLFGKSYKQVRSSCMHDNLIISNECVFIWSIFNAYGYSTFLGSDSTAGLIGSYEYSLSTIPTDFYLQPFISETRNLFENKHYSYHQCFRNKYYYKTLLNWSAQLFQKTNKKMFGALWEESISHENLNLPQSMDEDHYNFLQELENSTQLDDSIVIFFSDHGMRWGKIAQTKQGRLESRLPLFEILLPKQFVNQYPLAYKHFRENRYRLTTPYDIHETLLDLAVNNLEDYEISKRSLMVTYDMNRISLFLPVPEQRTCQIIGIDEHWCTCEKEERIVTNKEHKIFAANYLLQDINTLLRKYQQCHQLKLTKILNATVANKPERKGLTYWVVFKTSPGGGIFDGTIQRRDHQWSVSGTISRLNLYRHSSQCIKDVNVKMYCACKNYKKKSS